MNDIDFSRSKIDMLYNCIFLWFVQQIASRYFSSSKQCLFEHSNKSSKWITSRGCNCNLLLNLSSTPIPWCLPSLIVKFSIIDLNCLNPVDTSSEESSGSLLMLHLHKGIMIHLNSDCSFPIVVCIPSTELYLSLSTETNNPSLQSLQTNDSRFW